MSHNPKFNNSGSPDPTAYSAIKHVSDKDRQALDLIKVMKMVAQVSGFEVMNRITIRDKKTGREWY